MSRKIIVRSLGVIFLSVSSLMVAINMPQVDATVSAGYQLESPRISGAAYTHGAPFRGSHTISKDGRYIVFTSLASDMVSGDTNGVEDVFVRDTVNDVTSRVNVSNTGEQANSYSLDGSISYDGRYVVFTSTASNLSSGVTDTSRQHVYVRDLVASTTTLVDTSATGVIGERNANSPEISADGRFVVFSASGTNLVPGKGTLYHNQIYIKDLHTNAIKVLSLATDGSPGNLNSAQPDISCDGNVVVFSSTANNLGVPIGQSSGRADLILVQLGWSKDELSNVTLGSSIGITASEITPQISCDGNVALFSSWSTDIVSPSTPSGYNNIYQYNRLTGNMLQISLGNGNVQADTYNQNKSIDASMSGDGRYVAFSSYARNMDTTYPLGSDIGTSKFVYIRDTKKSTTETASLLPSGNRSAWAGNPAISPDASVIAFSHVTPSIYYPNRALITGISTGTTSSVYDLYKAETGY